MDDKPGLKNLVGRRDKIQFAQTVKKYDRKYKVSIFQHFEPKHVVKIHFTGKCRLETNFVTQIIYRD